MDVLVFSQKMTEYILKIYKAKAIPSRNRPKLLELFCQYNVELIFSGESP